MNLRADTVTTVDTIIQGVRDTIPKAASNHEGSFALSTIIIYLAGAVLAAIIIPLVIVLALAALNSLLRLFGIKSTKWLEKSLHNLGKPYRAFVNGISGHKQLMSASFVTEIIRALPKDRECETDLEFDGSKSKLRIRTGLPKDPDVGSSI